MLGNANDDVAFGNRDIGSIQLKTKKTLNDISTISILILSNMDMFDARMSGPIPVFTGG